MNWPLAMRNLGMRSTFQSLPLPMDSGGVSGRLKRLYSCRGEKSRKQKLNLASPRNLWSWQNLKHCEGYGAERIKTIKTGSWCTMALDVKWDVLRGIKYIDCFYRSQEPFTLPPPEGWWKSSRLHSKGSCPCAGPFSHSQTWSRTECIPA